MWDFGIPPSRWPATLWETFPSLPGKWLHMAPRAIKHMVMAPGPGLGLVAAFGLLNVWSARATRRLGLAAFGAALVPFVVCTTTESSERYVAVFLPLWAAGTAWGAAALGEGLGLSRWSAAALLIVMLPFTARAWMVEARQAAALRDWLAHERVALASRATYAERGRLLFSDTPDFAAWTTRRPAVALTVEGYRALPAVAQAGATMPLRSGDPLDEWFHADVRARPAPALGGPAR